MDKVTDQDLITDDRLDQLARVPTDISVTHGEIALLAGLVKMYRSESARLKSEIKHGCLVCATCNGRCNSDISIVMKENAGLKEALEKSNSFCDPQTGLVEVNVKMKLEWPWDEFPEDFSTWECCVEEHKKVSQENRSLKLKLSRMRDMFNESSENEEIRLRAENERLREMLQSEGHKTFIYKVTCYKVDSKLMDTPVSNLYPLAIPNKAYIEDIVFGLNSKLTEKLTDREFRHDVWKLGNRLVEETVEQVYKREDTLAYFSTFELAENYVKDASWEEAGYYNLASISKVELNRMYYGCPPNKASWYMIEYTNPDRIQVKAIEPPKRFVSAHIGV